MIPLSIAGGSSCAANGHGDGIPPRRLIGGTARP
jgi:hypothetical protein